MGEGRVVNRPGAGPKTGFDPASFTVHRFSSISTSERLKSSGAENAWP